MNKIINKENQKKLIITIVIVMLFNFVMPNYSFAGSGIVFKFLVPIILLGPDLIMEKLQKVFIADENSNDELSPFIEGPKGEIAYYSFLYSPAAIFSGRIASMDVNFISPSGINGEVTRTYEYYTFSTNPIEENLSLDDLKFKYGADDYVRKTSVSNPLTMIFGIGTSVRSITFEDDNGQGYYYIEKEDKDLPLILYILGGIIIGAITPFGWIISTIVAIGSIAVGYVGVEFMFDMIYDLFDGGGDLYITQKKSISSTKISIAYQLQGTVAKYYVALRTIALVALLCVLVYIAVRMIISTTAQDKAKYKKMLWDWLSAIIIVYLLHFFMSIVLTVLQAVNDIFAESFMPDGRDSLMSSIRGNIGSDFTSEDMSDVFFNILMYITLVIYTIQFTIIYLKRVINMAFLTMIAPLVAFTYPLDKIKDGQAQGLTTWLKEYSFNALMQPIHMILYWIFVGGAVEIVAKNPIYALVMIGFLKPAEKYIRQLFGLESDSSLGKMTSALGGAAVMNAINKMGAKAKGGFKGNGGKASGGENAGGTNKTRMANNGTDSYEALRNKNSKGADGQTKQNTGGNTPRTKGQTVKGTTTQTAGGTNTTGEKGNLKNSAGTKKGKWGARLKGGWKVAKKYGKNVARGTMRIAGAATLGTIGLAAGIATGDMSNAVAGLTGGITAGSKLGASAVDGAVNLAKGANGVRRDIVDTYRGGKLGKDEAERIRFDKDFKKTEGYKNLIKKHEGSEETVQEFLNAGVTDVGQMDKAMESGYSTEEAIAYMKMANSDECPDEVLYSPEDFKTFLASRGIDPSNAEKIREGIVKFK